MASNILITKLGIPRVQPDLVLRPRLTARLDAGLSGALTLVCAPAGFGKTTILADWLRAKVGDGKVKDNGVSPMHPSDFRPHAFKVAWLSLDEADNDPIHFLRYFVAALQRAMPGVGTTTLALLDLPQPPPLEAALTPLLNDLVTVEQPCIMVLDDYHVLRALPIHQAITFLLDHRPPQFHLVITTRADPPFALSRLRARRELCELRAADLRFTPDEAAAFLTQVMGIRVSVADVTALETRTEGWIAGLQLAALSMQGHTDIAGFIAAFTGSHRYILDYLSEEVLSRQSVEVQSFLLRTSILDRLCGPLCDAVLADGMPGADDGGGSNSEAMLHQLERANLFLVPLDSERRWYRYHHLFADLLRVRLHAQSDLAPQLHRRASLWYEAEGLLDEAVRHAVAAPDLDRAASLIEEHGTVTIFRSSQITQVRAWLEQLPTALVLARPRLRLTRAYVHLFTADFDAAERLIADVSVGSEPPDRAQQIQGEFLALQATVARMKGDSATTIKLAQAALTLLPDDSNRHRAGIALNLGVAYMQQGNPTAAKQALMQAATFSQLADHMWLALAALEELASLQIRQGELTGALHTCEEALAMVVRRGGRPIPATGVAYVGIGEILGERNDLAGARPMLERGIDLLRTSVERGLLVRGCIALARLHQAQGDHAAALAALEHGEDWFTQMRQPGGGAHVLLAAYRARLWLQQGHLADAARWAGEYLPHSHPQVHTFQDLTMARWQIAEYQRTRDSVFIQRAGQKLAQLEAAVVARGWLGYGIECLVLQALAQRVAGDSTAALQCLLRALTLAEPEGYVRLFVDEGGPMAELLTALKTNDLRLMAYIQRLLAQFPDVSAGLPVQLSNVGHPSSFASPRPSLVEPLSDRELEVLRLVADGLSNQAIADRLYITLGTVKKHINNIFGKLAVESRTQALVRAREMNII